MVTDFGLRRVAAWSRVRALKRRLVGSYWKKLAWMFPLVAGSGRGGMLIPGMGSGTISTNDFLLREPAMIVFGRKHRTAM